MSRRDLLAVVMFVCLCGAAGIWMFNALQGHPIVLPAPWSHISLLHPERLALACAIPPGLWFAHRSLADLGSAQRKLAVGLRAGLIAIVATALAEPSQETKTDQLALVYAVDVSDSVPDEALAQAARHLAQVRSDASEGADVQLVTFATHARAQALDEPSAAPAIARHGGGTVAEQDAATAVTLAAGAQTAPARALQLAYALMPHDRVRRVVLVSDGLQTRGDVLAEARRARRLGVQVDTLAMRQSPPPEMAIAALELPDEPDVGETFAVRVRIHATRSGNATLKLYQGGVLNALDGVRELTVQQGNNVASFRSLVRIAGPVRYRAKLIPAGPDHFSENNEVETATWAKGQPRVLLVDTEPGHLTALANALSAADYEVEVRAAGALPRSAAELAGYDFFILSNVPAERIEARHTRAIDRYVRVLGGGFLMAGGDQGHALGGFSGTAMERLLPVRMDSQRHDDEHSLGLALVIDTSGSMSGSKLALAKEAAQGAAELLSDDDLIEVIGFSSTPDRIVRMRAARHRTRIARDIGRLTAQGGTAIFPALDAAYEDLSLARARVKHVILLTDGQTPETGIPQLAQTMRAEGITVSTVGLGTDVNRSLLQRAANLGDGRAYFTNDPNRVPRIFMRETSTMTRRSAVEELVGARVREPADFLAGIDVARAPLLSGYVATSPKPKPAQVVLETELGEPLLARTRLGLGWSLAWTSDLQPRWASSWLRWKQFVPFLGQLVREHMRKPTHQSLPLSLQVRDGELIAEVDAIGSDDRFINALRSTLRVSGPLTGRAGTAAGAAGTAAGASDTPTVEHTMLQVAPGRYACRVPLMGYGAFSIEAEHRSNGRLVARSRAQLLHPYPEEYGRTEADLALLRAIAEAGDGQVDPSPQEVLAARGRDVPARRPLWPFLAGLALALFLVDLGVRRIQRPPAQRASPNYS